MYVDMHCCDMHSITVSEHNMTIKARFLSCTCRLGTDNTVTKLRCIQRKILYTRLAQFTIYNNHAQTETDVLTECVWIQKWWVDSYNCCIY